MNPATEMYIIPLRFQSERARLMLTGPAGEDGLFKLRAAYGELLARDHAITSLRGLRDLACEIFSGAGFQPTAA